MSCPLHINLTNACNGVFFPTSRTRTTPVLHWAANEHDELRSSKQKWTPFGKLKNKYSDFTKARNTFPVIAIIVTMTAFGGVLAPQYDN
jgi:hypothetical protein